MKTGVDIFTAEALIREAFPVTPGQSLDQDRDWGVLFGWRSSTEDLLGFLGSTYPDALKARAVLILLALNPDQSLFGTRATGAGGGISPLDMVEEISHRVSCQLSAFAWRVIGLNCSMLFSSN